MHDDRYWSVRNSQEGIKARKRGEHWDLSRHELRDVWERSGYLPPKGKTRIGLPTLLRRDDSQPWTAGNVWVAARPAKGSESVALPPRPPTTSEPHIQIPRVPTGLWYTNSRLLTKQQWLAEVQH